MADETDILLKEYETCQSHNNALGNQSWISISIIITVNLLLLGQVISSLVLKSYPDTGYSNFIFVTIIGLAMIYILFLFRQWDKRITFHTRLNHDRMREIEEVMVKEGNWVLQKNWRVRSLDITYDPKEKDKIRTIPKTFKVILKDLKKRFPKSKKNADKSKIETEYAPTVLKGFLKFDYIFYVLIALWVITIICETTIYFCPYFQTFLLN